ncbi:hypothetical protein BJS_02820 [Bradyrhizobium japonicum SEMIA 5079]|nr:hypothetical protein BJS_02820 [Bradyrhizobium japonicum SEMIA 5079]
MREVAGMGLPREDGHFRVRTYWIPRQLHGEVNHYLYLTYGMKFRPAIAILPVVQGRPPKATIASASLSPSSLRGALATKQSRISLRKDSGLLRYARNDGV